MRELGMALLLFGCICLGISTMMYGDIGVAAGMSGLTAIASGIGFLKINKILKNSSSK
ncbi:hypothetical protein [Mycoplasma sp. P36-A1]|uniref:hypothetical protein n=1 Tax=Mycoplasma sp. P36-A1 TaxID=3252900 RepID=UPI003C2FEF1E